MESSWPHPQTSDKAGKFYNLFRRTEEILESYNWKKSNPSKKFFVRLKLKDSYVGLALYEGDGDAESDGDPILSVKDEDDPLRNPKFYGFSVATGSSAETAETRLLRRPPATVEGQNLLSDNLN